MTHTSRRRGALTRGVQSLVVIGLTGLLFVVVIATRSRPSGNGTGRPGVADAHATARPPRGPGKTPEGFDVRVVTGSGGPALDPSEELPLETRKEVYAASRRNDTDAVEIAGTLYPDKRAPTDPESLSLYLDKRESIVDATRQDGRQTLIRRYGIDERRLAAIEQEGLALKWPEDPAAVVGPGGGGASPRGSGVGGGKRGGGRARRR